MSQTDFQWMTGFECSAFPQIGSDELEETQHYRWWASDLLRVREAGITMIRYGIPWHRVNPRPHEYDWRWTDQAMDLMASLGITPIVDMFHYGTPLWISDGIMNPIFGEMQGWYAKAFVQRYPHLSYFTPSNEPYIAAVFGAEHAIWYPFLKGSRNAARAMVNVAHGICWSMNEIRKVRPDALMMLPDTCEFFHPVDPVFEEETAFLNVRRFIVHDLYQGLVDARHPMADWLLRNGIEETELEWFLKNKVRLDILGLDYYKHSEHQFSIGPDGKKLDEPAKNQLGWAELARQYSSRYNGIPVFLAETNVGGPVPERIQWVQRLVQETRFARSQGVPICGLTYYGAVDHVDWDSGLRVRNLNINPCGMWSLERQGDKLVRRPTALVDLFRRYIDTPTEMTVGPLASPQAAERVRAILGPAARGPYATAVPIPPPVHSLALEVS